MQFFCLCELQICFCGVSISWTRSEYIKVLCTNAKGGAVKSDIKFFFHL